HQPSSSSTSSKNHATLHLNAFRAQPATTEFDWPFTPNHRSSPPFSTEVGAGLPAPSHTLHPAHGYITPLRVYDTRLTSPYSDALSLRLPHNGLTSPRTANSQAHSSKGTPSQLLRLL